MCAPWHGRWTNHWSWGGLDSNEDSNSVMTNILWEHIQETCDMLHCFWLSNTIAREITQKVKLGSAELLQALLQAL